MVRTARHSSIRRSCSSNNRRHFDCRLARCRAWSSSRQRTDRGQIVSIVLVDRAAIPGRHTRAGQSVLRFVDDSAVAHSWAPRRLHVCQSRRPALELDRLRSHAPFFPPTCCWSGCDGSTWSTRTWRILGRSAPAAIHAARTVLGAWPGGGCPGRVAGGGSGDGRHAVC